MHVKYVCGCQVYKYKSEDQAITLMCVETDMDGFAARCLVHIT